jgi:hypothetical protein
MSQINNSFGSGGMSLALNNTEISLFVQYLERRPKSLLIRKAATFVGRHKDSPVWVLGRDLQINADGQTISKEDKVYG